MEVTKFFLVMSSALVITVRGEEMCLEGCKCSEDDTGNYVIKCDKIGITAVPKDLKKFAGFEKPISLSLSENAIERVSNADFPPNVPVVSLDLSQNRGVMIMDDAFKNIKNRLRSLNLYGIRLPFTSKLNFLNGMTKLRTLSLSKNYQFGNGLIPAVLLTGLGLRSLTTLRFQDCYLKGIEDGAFSGLNLNGHLDLGANQLDHIPNELKTLYNLTSLDISQNNLKSIPAESFSGMADLVKLSINNNYISENNMFADSFFGLRLEELSMEQFELKTIPKVALEGFKTLKVLKLRNNPIKSIPEGSFNGSYCLEELDISNALVEIDMVHLEGQMDCIQTLHLDNMQMKEVPAFIKDFKMLDVLSLEGNLIKKVKKGDFVGSTVSKVSLAKNPLSEIESGAFEEFPHSITLDLSDTRITNFNFVRDYPYGTIREINLDEITPICDCELAFAEYRTYAINGNCNLNGTRAVAISTMDFMEVTSDCWPGGRTPTKKNVWAVKGGNHGNVISSFAVLNIIPFSLVLIFWGRI